MIGPLGPVAAPGVIAPPFGYGVVPGWAAAGWDGVRDACVLGGTSLPAQWTALPGKDGLTMSAGVTQ